MADNRPIVYQEGDRWVYRASAIGRSVRCLLLARRGYSPLAAPDYLEKAAEAGGRYEKIVKARLREDGYKIGGEQVSVEIPVGTTAVVRGHLDAGFITADNGEVEPIPHMLEIKSMSARMFRKWELHGFGGFPHYAAQLTAYMTGTGRPALYAVVNRDTDEIIIQAFAVPPTSWADLADKIDQVETLATAGAELPECKGDAGYFCPFEYFCDQRQQLFEEVEAGTEHTLIHLAEEYDRVRTLEEEVKSRREEVYRELTIALGGREAVKAGKWRITHKSIKSSSLDKKALAQFLAQNGKTLDDFTTESSYRRLNVK